MTWRRRTLVALALLAAALTWASAWYIHFNLPTLVDGADHAVALVERMVPPKIDDPGRIVELTLETIEIALLGTVFATALSIPLAFLAARNTTPHPLAMAAARGVITFCRAVPDLVFAVLFVRAIGIGVLPGVLAIAVHSVGMLGKLFADAIEETDPGPREAVRATGVGRVRELLNGVVPQVVPSWISAFVYRVDINLRTSVVLGFVGAGGIGFALQDSLRSLVYPEALGIVLVILLAIALMELASIGIRRVLLSPRSHGPLRERAARFTFGGLLIAATVWSFVDLRINPAELVTSLDDLVAVAGRLVPPDFGLVGDQLPTAFLETLAIAAVATAIGICLSIPLGVLAAHTVSPHPTIYWLARGAIVVVRAVPELILAVVFVAAVGLGPIAGACALGLGSIGFLGKLVADALEEIKPGPLEAVRAVGGGWWKVLIAAVLPQALPSMIGSVLYLLDVNIRTSTVLGIVGAGGIGFLLFESIRTLNYEFAGAIILIIFATVYVIERISGWIRAQLV